MHVIKIFQKILLKLNRKQACKNIHFWYYSVFKTLSEKSLLRPSVLLKLLSCMQEQCTLVNVKHWCSGERWGPWISYCSMVVDLLYDDFCSEPGLSLYSQTSMTLLLNVSARVVSNCGTPPVLVVTVGNSSCIKYIPYYYIVESLVNRTLYYNVCDIFF